MKTLHLHTDNGHGWLAVKRARLIELGILGDISHYSYQRGATVYLEEDCDMYKFMVAEDCRTWAELQDKYTVKATHKDRSPVRSYDAFSVRG